MGSSCPFGVPHQPNTTGGAARGTPRPAGPRLPPRVAAARPAQPTSITFPPPLPRSDSSTASATRSSGNVLPISVPTFRSANAATVSAATRPRASGATESSHTESQNPRSVTRPPEEEVRGADVRGRGGEHAINDDGAAVADGRGELRRGSVGGRRRGGVEEGAEGGGGLSGVSLLSRSARGGAAVPPQGRHRQQRRKEPWHCPAHCGAPGGSCLRRRGRERPTRRSRPSRPSRRPGSPATEQAASSAGALLLVSFTRG